MKKYLLLLLLFSGTVYGDWTIGYTFSKFENKKIPLQGWNVSNEDKNIQLDLYLNSRNQIGLWIVGFPYGYETGMVFPPNSEYFTPYRIRVGNKVFNLRGGSLHFIREKWIFPIALERDTNSELMKLVLDSLDKKEDIAFEFSNTGKVYTFSGGVKKLN